MLEAEQDDDGKDIPLSAADYILHFISFFWKVVFAFIPPRYVAWNEHMVMLLFVLVLECNHLLIGKSLSEYFYHHCPLMFT